MVFVVKAGRLCRLLLLYADKQDMATPQLSICIPTCNRAAILRDTLEHLAGLYGVDRGLVRGLVRGGVQSLYLADFQPFPIATRYA